MTSVIKLLAERSKRVESVKPELVEPEEEDEEMKDIQNSSRAKAEKATSNSDSAKRKKNKAKMEAEESQNKFPINSLSNFFTKKLDVIELDETSRNTSAVNADNCEIGSQILSCEVDEVSGEVPQKSSCTETEAIHKNPANAHNQSSEDVQEATNILQDVSKVQELNTTRQSKRKSTDNQLITKKQQMMEDLDFEVLKVLIQNGGTKSKEAIIKEMKAITPWISERQIALKLSELAMKEKWPNTPSKTWRLKKDVSEEDLLFIKDDRHLKKSIEKSDSKHKHGSNKKPPTVSIKVNPDVKVVVGELVERLMKDDCQTLDILKRIHDLRTQIIDELKEIFFYVDSKNSSQDDLLAKLKESDFQEKQPTENVVKLIALFVSDSRNTSINKLAETICDKFKEKSCRFTPSVKLVESYIELLAERVEYHDDYWAYEMVKKDEKANKLRKASLKSLQACIKTLCKLKKDVETGKFDLSKFELAMKEASDKFLKVKRDWFNREEKQTSKLQGNQSKIKKVTAPVDNNQNTLLMFGFQKKAVKIEQSTTGNMEPKISRSTDCETKSQDSDVEVIKEEVNLVNSSSNDDSKLIRKRKRNRRRVVLFVDSRVRILNFSRATKPEYFKLKDLSGKTPFSKSSFIDYDIDSEDEDGESLTGEDKEEEEEDSGLDYKDGWLERDNDLNLVAPIPLENQVRIPRVIGLCYNLVTYTPAELCLNNQNFEAQNEDPNKLLQFSVEVRKRSIGEIEKKDPSKGLTRLVSNKKPKRTIQDGKQLKIFVELTEGSTLNKDALIAQYFEKLKIDCPNEILPAKVQIREKLSEIAKKVGKHWEVNYEILESLGVARKEISGLKKALK